MTNVTMPTSVRTAIQKLELCVPAKVKSASLWGFHHALGYQQLYCI